MKIQLAVIVIILVTITVLGRMLADEPVAYQPTTTVVQPLTQNECRGLDMTTAPNECWAYDWSTS